MLRKEEERDEKRTADSLTHSAKLSEVGINKLVIIDP